jgi:hypothetical protein
LDQYFSNWDGPKIELTKCDVEGHALEVFKGAKNKLLEERPTLVFECHHEEAKESITRNLIVIVIENPGFVFGIICLFAKIKTASYDFSDFCY